MTDYGKGLRRWFDTEMVRLPLDAPAQEPSAYWAMRLVDPNRDLATGGSRPISVNGLLRVIGVQIADRQTSYVDQVVIVGQVARDGQLDEELFEVDIHSRLALSDRDRGCGNCRKYTVDLLASTMTEREVESPWVLPLFPDQDTALIVRGQVAEAVRGIATGELQNDPTWPSSHQAYQIFSEMVIPHKIDQDLVAAVRQSYAA